MTAQGAVDTTLTREIRQRPGILKVLMGFMATLALACLGFAGFGLLTGAENPLAYGIVLAGTVLFGFLALYQKDRLRFGDGVVVRVSPDGFLDRRLGDVPIRWDEIRQIRMRGANDTSTVGLELQAVAFARFYPGRLRRALQKLNQLGGCWVASPTHATDTDAFTYRDLLLAYAAAHGGLQAGVKG